MREGNKISVDWKEMENKRGVEKEKEGERGIYMYILIDR